MRSVESVRNEEVRALYAQGAPVLWANLGVAAVVLATLWNVVPRVWLTAWFSALVVMSVVRVEHLKAFRGLAQEHVALDSWGRRFAIGSAVSGVLWGAAGAFFFDPESALAQSLLTFAIGGMVAAAAGTLSCHLPAFFAFFIPALTPLALRSFAEGDRMHLGLGALVLAYAIGMQRVARTNHRAFVRAFGLATENAELVSRLESSQVDLTTANRTLEQRVAERTLELTQQGQALQASQRLEVAGRLAGGLAHDFNSLLTVVLNNARLLKESRLLDEQGRLAADETLEAARRGATLIRQMLAFSHRNRTEPRVFDLNRLVGEWAGVMRHLIGEGGRAEVELAAETIHVRADAAQIEQVLVNLVTNARGSTGASTALHVRTRIAKPPVEARLLSIDYVELCVGDASAALTDAPRELDVDPTESDPQKRYLGLATVRAIVEHWEGRLLIESRADGGTCFRVYLPLSREPLSPISEKKIENAAPARGATVLVVDDEATLRSVMRRCLVREGFEVLVAPDGPRALELAKQHGAGIDVLLTDVMMPGLSGVELAKRLLLERPEIVVLFVSGYTFDETMPVLDTEQGMSFLAKPFDTKVLLEKVQELLAARAPRSTRAAAHARAASLRPIDP